MEIKVTTRQRDYSIFIEHGLLKKARSLIGEGFNVFIISDDGVDDKWISILLDQYPDSPLFRFNHGEANKNLNTYRDILSWLAGNRANRHDVIIAVGGGVVGDVAGFVAATYMRGIRYVNIPTTTLAQIDSSIGGKTAVDLGGIKNIVGAFWQPSLVLIDPETLSTLPSRHVNNGLAEAVKMGLILDEKLFELFEGDYESHLDEIIERSLVLKKEIVEQDENETGIRKLLNFGHTFGHGYETVSEGRYLHGECVAMGMMTVLENEEIKERLHKVLQKLDLPESCECDSEKVFSIICNDKKSAADGIDIVQVDEIGKGHIERWSFDRIRRKLG